MVVHTQISCSYTNMHKTRAFKVIPKSRFWWVGNFCMYNYEDMVFLSNENQYHISRDIIGKSSTKSQILWNSKAMKFIYQKISTFGVGEILVSKNWFLIEIFTSHIYNTLNNPKVHILFKFLIIMLWIACSPKPWSTLLNLEMCKGNFLCHQCALHLIHQTISCSHGMGWYCTFFFPLYYNLYNGLCCGHYVTFKLQNLEYPNGPTWMMTKRTFKRIF
jgi:hypothetical protein